MKCLLIGLIFSMVFTGWGWGADPRDKIGLYVTPDEENDPEYNVSYTCAVDTLKGYACTVWCLERWRRIETADGVFDWTSLDRRVNKAAERGFDLGLRLQLVLCGNDAQKRSVAMIQTPAYVGDTMDNEVFRTAIVRFFGTAAARYKGKVKYIAVGNTVNKYFERHPEHWEGFKKVYPAIVDAIHAADPGIIVMSDLASGDEFFNDEAKMDKYAAYYRACNDDAFGYLFYYISGVYYGKDFKNFGPENMQACLEKLKRWSGNKKFYIIETACFSSNPNTGKDMAEIQARFVDMLLSAVMDKEYILGVSWWLLYDAKNLPEVAWDVKAGFGLLDESGKGKPAWETWKKLAGREAAVPKQETVPNQP